MNGDESIPSIHAMRVGERLRMVREERGLSLEEVELGTARVFTASVLDAYERGELTISVPRLARLARFYDVAVHELYPLDFPPGVIDSPIPRPTPMLRAVPGHELSVRPFLRPPPLGASFVDAVSGLRFEAHHPTERPDLWRAYLDGAEARYGVFGVEHVLDLPLIEDGRTTSLFFVGIDAAGKVVAGLRCNGPIGSAADAFVLRELHDHPQLRELWELLERRVPLGLVEIKGAWVAAEAGRLPGVSDALARCYVHAMSWFSTRYAFCSCSVSVAQRWEAVGGRRTAELVPVPYPDERYQTVLLWWDRERMGETASAEQWVRILDETEQLAGRSPAPPRAPVEVVGAPAVSAVDPIVLDPRVEAERELVEQLRRDQAVEVVDAFEGQLASLRGLLPTAAPELVDEPARWVYYPWRRCLVKLLGPAAFRTLRLDRNRNKITPAEQEQLGRTRIGVVGLSVGHAIAYVLALEGICGELRLADFDTVELSNLNRIPATVLDLGLNKALVARRRIAELDPYLPVVVIPEGLRSDNLEDFLNGLDVVVEECDSLDLKVQVREAARRRRIPVVMETSDRGLLDVERFDLDPVRPIFHGLLGDVRPEELVGLSTHDKVPHVLRILEPRELSARMAASMAEVDETTTTWPQLGGDVTLGAATIAAAIRRLKLGERLPSGRVRIDLGTMLDEVASPRPAVVDLRMDAPVPREEPPEDPFLAVAHAATLAPSGGNMQPWRLSVDTNRLELYVNRAHTVAMNVRFRGTYLTAGTALFNARVAASARGILGPIELLPQGPDSDLVAVMHFGDEIDLDLADWYPAVLERATNRHPGSGEPLAPEVVTALEREAAREGGTLHVITGRDQVTEYAELLAESDRLRHIVPRLHTELMRELRWPGHDPLEMGIDVRTLELDAADVAKLAVARRADVMAQLAAWDAGRALGEVTRERVPTSSAIAVVTVPADDVESYIRGGAALERVWLAAHRAGLGVHPVSPVYVLASEPSDFASLVPPSRVEDLQTMAGRFRRLMGIPADEYVVLVIRVSYSPAPTFVSGRRPLHTVLTNVTLAPAVTRH